MDKCANGPLQCTFPTFVIPTVIYLNIQIMHFKVSAALFLSLSLSQSVYHITCERGLLSDIHLNMFLTLRLTLSASTQYVSIPGF